MTRQTCDMCGKEFDEFDSAGNLGIHEPFIRYGSFFDGESINVDLCCDCFDKLIVDLNTKCKHKFIDPDYEVEFNNRDGHSDDDNCCGCCDCREKSEEKKWYKRLFQKRFGK